jgi:hypothetical protein
MKKHDLEESLPGILTTLFPTVQPALKGQVIHFYQDVHEVPAQLLPRPPNESGIVVVTSHLRDVHKIIELRVDFIKLERALNWLKENNPLYADVQIDMSRNFSVEQICRVPQEISANHQRSWVVRNDKRVLQATIHQGHGTFDIWAGKQCVAMCVAAAVKSKIVSVVEWTPDIMTDILLKGNSYYKRIVGNNPDFLLVNELPTSQNEENLLFGRDFELDFADDPEYFGPTDNVLQIVQSFFTQHYYGIIIDSSNYARLIFQIRSEDGYYYYLFDSHACTVNGATSFAGRGKAAIVEAPSIEILVRVLRQSMRNSLQFTLDSIEVNVLEFSPEMGARDELNIDRPIVEEESAEFVDMQHSVLLNIDSIQPRVSDVANVRDEEQVSFTIKFIINQ